jgi:hypothetical protein
MVFDMDALVGKNLDYVWVFQQGGPRPARAVEASGNALMLALLWLIRLSDWLKMDCWRSAAMIFYALTGEGRVNLRLDQKD